MGLKPLLFVLLSIGLLWAKSSYGKFTSGNFIANLGETLNKVTPKNPYPFFKQFLTQVVIPNSVTFGNLVLWGELLCAIAITVGSIILLLNPNAGKLIYLALIVGLLGGIFLNMVFWLGFGWSNVSTDSLNLLMAVVQAIGVVYLLKALQA